MFGCNFIVGWLENVRPICLHWSLLCSCIMESYRVHQCCPTPPGCQIIRCPLSRANLYLCAGIHSQSYCVAPVLTLPHPYRSLYQCIHVLHLLVIIYKCYSLCLIALQFFHPFSMFGFSSSRTRNKHCLQNALLFAVKSTFQCPRTDVHL